MAPEGNRIWADHPEREARLMDWIEQHPIEAKVIFEKPRSSRNAAGFLIHHPEAPDTSLPSRRQCYELACHAVFCADEDDMLRKKLATDPTSLVASVRCRIHDSWAKFYRRVNNAIGQDASNTPLEDVRVGSEMYTRINEELVAFPLWKRLHVFWRTDPMFNPFYPPPMEQSTFTNTPTASTSARLLKRRRHNDEGVVVSLHKLPEHAATREQDEDVKVIDVDGVSEGADVKEITSTTAKAVIQRKINSLKRKREDGPQAAVLSGLKTDQVSGLTASQKHERELAELAVKFQQLENEALEKKTAAELRRLEIKSETEERRRAAEIENQRAKEKHEMMMRMMSLAMMGNPGAEGLNL